MWSYWEKHWGEIRNVQASFRWCWTHWSWHAVDHWLQRHDARCFDNLVIGHRAAVTNTLFMMVTSGIRRLHHRVSSIMENVVVVPFILQLQLSWIGWNIWPGIDNNTEEWLSCSGDNVSTTWKKFVHRMQQLSMNPRKQSRNRDPQVPTVTIRC